MVSLRLLVRSLALAGVALVPVQSVAQTVTPVPIRIALLGYGSASALPAYADKAGFFKRHGIDGQITTLPGGAAIVAALAGGSLDIGFSNITSAVAALQRGIPIVVLSAASLSAPGHEDATLMKARGSRLKSGADLNGKTIAVTSLGATLQFCAESWIDKTGGDSKTVHFVELAGSNMADALKAGRIDAAMMSEPNITAGAADVEVLADAFSTIAPQWIASVFVASKAWVTANPDGARRFVSAMREAARSANTHEHELSEILSPLAGLPVASLDAMQHSVYTDQLTRRLMQPGIDAAFHYGALKAPFDTAEIVSAAAPYLPR
jgi:NitT/TauT family transport system substrate-binding protein